MENYEIKEQTIKTEKEVVQLDIMNKERPHMQQTLYDRGVQEKALTDGLIATQQATELLKITNESLDDLDKKLDIIKKLNQESGANSQLWCNVCSRISISE